MRSQFFWRTWVLAIGVAGFYAFVHALFAGAPDGEITSRMSAAIKLITLAVGAIFGARAARSQERTNPVRAAWWLLTAWLAAFAIGQAVIVAYVLAQKQAPDVSPGDAFFLAGYLLMIAAAFRFVRVYRESGLPVGSARDHAGLAALALLCIGAGGAWLLGPIFAADKPLVERLIIAAYPVLDFIVLLPIALLFKITWQFRGSGVWRVWVALLAGFVCAALADTLFAYYAALGDKRLGALADSAFVISYALLAYGAVLQDALFSAGE